MEDPLVTLAGQAGGFGLFGYFVYKALEKGLDRVAQSLEKLADAIAGHAAHLVRIEAAVESQLALVSKMEERGFRLQRPTPNRYYDRPPTSEPTPMERPTPPDVVLRERTPIPPFRGDTEDGE